MKVMTMGFSALALSLIAQPAAAQSAADFVPSGAVLSVHIPNLGQAIDGARNAVETVCAHPFLSKALQDGLQEVAREVGFNPLQKNTWKTMGIDVTRDAAFFLSMTEQSSFEPLFGFAIPVSDGEALQAFMGRLAGRERKLEWRAVEGLEGAVQPWVESYDGESMNAEEMIIAFKNGYAVICGADDDDMVIESARLALAGGNGLASDAAFGEARQSLGARHAYMNMRLRTLFQSLTQMSQAKAEDWRRRAAEAGEDGEWMKDVASSMDSEASQMTMIADMMKTFGDQFVMGLSADETGVRVGSWMKGPGVADMTKSRAAHPALNALIQPSAMTLLRYSVNPNMLEQMFLGLPSELKDDMDLEEIEAGLEMVNGMLGVDLVQDIWRQWSGRVQFSMAAPEEAMHQAIVDAIIEGDMDEQRAMELAAMADLTLAIEFVDSKGANTLVETGLSLLGESLPVIVEMKEIAGGKLWNLGPDLGGDAQMIGAVAIVHNTLVAGTARGVDAALARVAGQAAPQVADENVQKSLADPNAMAFYLDMKPIHKLVKTLSESIPQQELAIAEGVLMTLDAMASWSGTKGDVARSEFVVRFR